MKLGVGTSELGLVNAAKSGNRDAFAVIFEINKNAIYTFVRKSIVRREDAEDIVQEVFCRAWKSIDSFRGGARLLSWLYKIAVSVTIDHVRATKSRPCPVSETGLEESEVENILDVVPDIGPASIMRQVLDEGLGQLPLTHRMLVILCDVQGFTCKEAAEIVGCSSVSARVRLCRAHKTLRNLLTQDEVQ